MSDFSLSSLNVADDDLKCEKPSEGVQETGYFLSCVNHLQQTNHFRLSLCTETSLDSPAVPVLIGIG